MASTASGFGSSHPHHDHVSLMRRLGDDLHLLGEVLVLFEQDVGARVAELRGGVARQDAAAIARAAHSLRGMAGIFSAAEAESLARVLEKTSLAGALDGAPELVAHLEQELALVAAELHRTLGAVPVGEPV